MKKQSVFDRITKEVEDRKAKREQELKKIEAELNKARDRHEEAIKALSEAKASVDAEGMLAAMQAVNSAEAVVQMLATAVQESKAEPLFNDGEKKEFLSAVDGELSSGNDADLRSICQLMAKAEVILLQRSPGVHRLSVCHSLP